MNPPLDLPPVSHFNPQGKARVLLVCEHACSYIPARFENLQLSTDVLGSHAAVDIGALDLAKSVSRLLDAPLLSTAVSRLIYDCNRAFGASGAIPEKSEVFEIPGNRNLSDAEVRKRYDDYYLPFETAISNCLENYDEPPLLVTIHSFTPVYYGSTREVDIGIICDQDKRLADQMVSQASALTDLCVKLNDPYGPGDGVTHTLALHGYKNDLLNTMIEVKNDLLGTVEQRQDMALILATMISRSAERFGYEIPLIEDN